MRLPPPYHDLEKAKECLENGLKLSPNSSFGNHAMAMFMMKYSQVYSFALFYDLNVDQIFVKNKI